MRLAVFISGRGSNLEALLRVSRLKGCPFEVALVVCDTPHAQGMGYAHTAGVPCHLYDPTNEDHEALSTTLLKARCTFLCLAGFMTILKAPFVHAWSNKIINIHPSLLPAFPGLCTHKRVLASGEHSLHGCSVHLVRPQVDSGPLIAQAQTPIHRGEGEESLAQRVLALEHKLYPLVMLLVAHKCLLFHGDTVVTTFQKDPLLFTEENLPSAQEISACDLTVGKEVTDLLSRRLR